MNYYLVIDVAKCHNCNNCLMACKDEYYENDFLPYSVAQPRHGQRWINIFSKEKGQFPKVEVAYLPVPCGHCEDAPCVQEGLEGVYRREDGIVIIDPEKAKGNKDIVDVCPYGAVYWNENKNVAQKCTLCAHLLDSGWKEPRCVQVCPTGALTFYHIEDVQMQQTIKIENLDVYHPEFKTNPRVYYKNLTKFEKLFIAGSVALHDTDECAEGAKITLTPENSTYTLATIANNYGDFKFEDLGSGTYELDIEYFGYDKHTSVVLIEESLNVGTVVLKVSPA